MGGGEQKDEKTSGVTFSHASSRVPGFRWVRLPRGPLWVYVNSNATHRRHGAAAGNTVLCCCIINKNSALDHLSRGL